MRREIPFPNPLDVICSPNHIKKIVPPTNVITAETLKKRIWFTLLALLVYRLGTYLPLPGINIDTLRQIFEQNQSGIIGIFNMFAGGAVGRMAILSLGIMPYITSSIIIQLVVPVVPRLNYLKKEGGEQGRRQINQYTRYLSLIHISEPTRPY